MGDRSAVCHWLGPSEDASPTPHRSEEILSIPKGVLICETSQQLIESRDQRTEPVTSEAELTGWYQDDAIVALARPEVLAV